MINIKIDFTPDGKAIIRLPEGKTQQADANKAADLTDKLAKSLGKVTERHIGGWKGGVHTHEDGHTHSHE